MAHVDIKVELYRRCKTKAKAWLTKQNGWDRATVGVQQWKNAHVWVWGSTPNLLQE